MADFEMRCDELYAKQQNKTQHKTHKRNMLRVFSK